MKVFDFVQGIKPKRNKFDLSYENKLTLNMGYLVPIFTHEVLPGDDWRVNSQILLRMLALVAPVLHRVDVWTHYFFVPNRLIWDEWEDFITGGVDGNAAPVPPYFNVGAVGDSPTQAGSLLDYLGLGVLAQARPNVGDPTQKPIEISALPVRAYQLIYDQYYRDQNYIDTILFDGWKASGNTYTSGQKDSFLELQKRAWEHDYFTSILPSTQRGSDVLIPFAPEYTINYKTAAVVKTQDGGGVTTDPIIGDGANPGHIQGKDLVTGNYSNLEIENIDSIEASSDVTVNSLRQSVSLQGFLEAMMRFGSRYVEYLRGIFGTNPRDSRLQRPEYLGGGIQQMIISEVLQTGQPTGTSSLPQGNMAGHGISVGRTNGFHRSFDEHGFVMGIMSVIPKTQYNSNMDRMWFRTSRLDYYQPHLAHLGERSVLQVELQMLKNTTKAWTPFSLSDPSADNNTVLGYQSQYAEYKYISGQTHGQFNSTLAFWTLGRLFDSSNLTPIDRDFIECTARNDIFAVEDDTDHLVCQIYHEVSVLRPIPLFSTPALLFPSHA